MGRCPGGIRWCKTSGPVQPVPREHWSSRIDYLLSLAGLAIGLGNVWRFPYLCFRNGGGAFLIPYVLMLVFVGIPMFLLETSMAQFGSVTVLGVYEICPALKGVGFASLVVTSIATSYYCVLVAYPLLFIWHSLTTNILPWATCDNYWNSNSCVPTGQLQTYDNDSDYHSPNSTMSVSSSKEFFHNKIIQLSDGIGDLGGPVPGVHIANAIVWITVFFTIFKGVKILGKVVWFTALFPFVVLAVMLIRGLTLPGAFHGIAAFLRPDFERLLHVKVWADAAVQVFFSLGTGWGSLFCLGSFSKFRNNTVQDAWLVPVINGLTSFVAGLVVFSVLGFMAHTAGRSIYDVAAEGIDLAFIVYPEAIAMMPGSQLWSIAFFLMIFFLGIDSCFVQVETVVATLLDQYPRLQARKILVTLMVCLVIHLGSMIICTKAGIYWIQLFDSYPATYAIIFVGLCEMIAFAFFYGPGNVVRDIQLMTGKQLSGYWWFCWMYSCPLMLGFIFLFMLAQSSWVRYEGTEFPAFYQYLGMFLVIFTVLIVPIYWLYYVLSAKGTFQQRLSRGHSPSSHWGPVLEHHMEQWKAYTTQLPSSWLTRYQIPKVSPPPPTEEVILPLVSADARVMPGGAEPLHQ